MSSEINCNSTSCSPPMTITRACPERPSSVTVRGVLDRNASLVERPIGINRLASILPSRRSISCQRSLSMCSSISGLYHWQGEGI